MIAIEELSSQLNIKITYKKVLQFLLFTWFKADSLHIIYFLLHCIMVRELKKKRKKNNSFVKVQIFLDLTVHWTNTDKHLRNA